MAHFDEFRKIGILRNQAFRSVPFRRLVGTLQDLEGVLEEQIHDQQLIQQKQKEIQESPKWENPENQYPQPEAT